jgi:hypothetical protein
MATNISKFFLDELHAADQVTIEELVKKAIEQGLKVEDGSDAGSQQLNEDWMMPRWFQQAVQFFLLPQVPDPVAQATPVIVPCNLSEAQVGIYNQWIEAVGADDEYVDDEEEYAILDSIKWKFAPEWRERYPKIDTVGNL